MTEIPEDKIQLATNYILETCPNIASYSLTFENGQNPILQFLKELCADINNSKPSKLFPEDLIKNVSYAIQEWVKSCEDRNEKRPGVLASVYLATRFEFYFRILSNVLNADGT